VEHQKCGEALERQIATNQSLTWREHNISLRLLLGIVYRRQLRKQGISFHRWRLNEFAARIDFCAENTTEVMSLARDVMSLGAQTEGNLREKIASLEDELNRRPQPEPWAQSEPWAQRASSSRQQVEDFRRTVSEQVRDPYPPSGGIGNVPAPKPKPKPNREPYPLVGIGNVPGLVSRQSASAPKQSVSMHVLRQKQAEVIPALCHPPIIIDECVSSSLSYHDIILWLCYK